MRFWPAVVGLFVALCASASAQGALTARPFALNAEAGGAWVLGERTFPSEGPTRAGVVGLGFAYDWFGLSGSLSVAEDGNSESLLSGSVGVDAHVMREYGPDDPATVSVGVQFLAPEAVPMVVLPNVGVAARVVDRQGQIVVPHAAVGMGIASESVEGGRGTFASFSGGVTLGFGSESVRFIVTPALTFVSPAPRGSPAFGAGLTGGIMVALE